MDSPIGFGLSLIHIFGLGQLLCVILIQQGTAGGEHPQLIALDMEYLSLIHI